MHHVASTLFHQVSPAVPPATNTYLLHMNVINFTLTSLKSLVKFLEAQNTAARFKGYSNVESKKKFCYFWNN